MSSAYNASRFRWVALSMGFIGQFSASLAFQAVAPLSPLFQAELGLTKTEVGLFSSILFAGQVFVLLPAGGMVDRFGIRVALSAGLVIVGAALLSITQVTSYYGALTVLFVAGLGSASVLPAATKAIAEWFPPAVRGTFMGLKQAAMPVAGVTAASILPAVGLAFGWRNAMASVGLVGILGGVAAFLLYRDAPRPAREGGPRTSFRTSVRAVIGNRRLWQLSLFSVVYIVVQLALTSYLALFLKEVVLVEAFPSVDSRVVAAGWYLAVCQSGGAIGRVFWGVVSDRVFGGRRMVVLGITGVISVVCAVATSMMAPGFPLWLVLAVLFLFGASAIGWNGLYHVAMAEIAGQKYAGTGIGFSMTLNQAGTFGGPPLFGFVVDSTGSYQGAWMLMAGFALAGTLMAFFNSRGERERG